MFLKRPNKLSRIPVLMKEQLGSRVMNGVLGTEKHESGTRQRRMMYRARKGALQSICIHLQILDGLYALINHARGKGAAILRNIIMRGWRL